jgi:hypothetical protein
MTRQRYDDRTSDIGGSTRFAFSLHALPYNLGNFMQTMPMPAETDP